MSRHPNHVLGSAAVVRSRETFKPQRYIVQRSETDATKLSGHDELGPCIRSAEVMGGIVRRSKDGVVVWPVAAGDKS